MFLSILPWIGAGCLLVYCLIGTLGIITICWPVCVEILAPPMRPLISPYILATSTVIAFLALKTFADFIQTIELAGTFLTYAVISVLFSIFIAAFVPETKNTD